MLVTDRRSSTVLIAALAGFATLLVYLRALNCGFVNFDDPLYVLNNPLIRQLDLDTLGRAFSESRAGFWMPLTWISLAVDYRFWGLNPFGYHLTNIMLHGLNAGLLVVVADRVLRGSGTGCRWAGESFYPFVLLLAGLLWGIHPLRVESVAWVTERKDVLNGLFAFLTVLAYLRYAGRPSITHYLLSLLLFACSLMAKPVTVVLPVMLLVMDWFPLGRLERRTAARLLVEKIPFFLMSAAMAVLTVKLVADINVLVPYDRFPIGQRILVSGNAIFEYCRLMIYPLNILPLYVFPNPLPALFYLTTLLSVAAICCCLALAGKKPWITATALLFLLPLSPALAFFQNGDQILAARFTYLPAVAVSIAAAALFANVTRQLAGSRLVMLPAACAVVLVLSHAVISFHLIGYWKDTGAYWSRIIEVQPIGRAYGDRGMFYLESGRYAEAVDDLDRAARIAVQVGMPEAFNLVAIRGEALSKMGRHAEAVRDFSEAIDVFPAPEYFYRRGMSLMALGRKQEAEEDLRRGKGATGPIKWYKPE